ncbi:NAD(P)-dependent alcohol dehydrogenase [Alteribacillus sp. HJP-4]|uniref:NAD(P)-dependent alcohol dehydrogenase n=1 Tax=Alteribacillus sp. HJP-4 TaxID=2775394 RepID=UPI0035CCDFC9
MIATRMNAAVMNKPGDINIQMLEIPTPKRNEALVKVHCIGICGSDIHYYEHGKIGNYVVKKPIILGHELAGEVVEIGEGVTDVKIGDRVAVEPGIPCGECKYCKGGRYNLCPDVEFMATPPIDGAWAEFVAVKSDFLHTLPDHVSFEEGALLEPLSVGVHAMTRGSIGPGDCLLVTGLGPVGLLAIEAAKMYGVTEIYGSDVVANRRELALEMGAAGVIDPSKEDMKNTLLSLTGDTLPNVLVETSGNARAVTSSIHMVERGGRLVFVGLPVENEVPIDMLHLVDSEFDVFGVFRYANTYPKAIQGLDNPLVDVKKVITHSFSLENINQALEVATTQKNSSIKIMIYP